MAERTGLFVGMDHYTNEQPLSTCVNGANTMAKVLSTHEDGSANFSAQTLVSDDGAPVSREKLMDWFGDLLSLGDADSDLLFYFSGHGRVTSLGPELVTEEESGATSGVSMDQVAAAANRRELRSLTIILDCCRAGSIGEMVPLSPGSFGVVQLAKGSALLAAASEAGNAFEGVVAHSWFTGALLQGLSGAAADLSGRVTPAGLHGLAESALAGTNQDPVLKVYSDTSTVLRRCTPDITREQLRALKSIFGDDEVAPTVPRQLEAVLSGPAAVNAEAMAIQAMVRHGLIAAERSSATGNMAQLSLTRRGLHYWHLALEGVFDDKSS